MKSLWIFTILFLLVLLESECTIIASGQPSNLPSPVMPSPPSLVNSPMPTVLASPLVLQKYDAIQGPEKHVKLPALLLEVEDKYKSSGTLEAKFKQNTESQLLKKKSSSNGIIRVKRPGKVRFETLAPDPSLMMSDGKKFWFYTPPFDESEPGQYYEMKASVVKSQVAHALLSGQFSVMEGAEVEIKSNHEFLIHLKKGSAGTVTQALIDIDVDQKMIKGLTLTHSDGNTAQFELNEIKLGNPIEDAEFVFKAPPKTVLMKQ